jgi:hypothetical protein
LGSLNGNAANIIASETTQNGLHKTRSVRSTQRSVKSIAKNGNSVQSLKSENTQKQDTPQRDQLQFGKNSQFEGSNLKLLPQEETQRDDANYTPDFL